MWVGLERAARHTRTVPCGCSGMAHESSRGASMRAGMGPWGKWVVWSWGKWSWWSAMCHVTGVMPVTCLCWRCWQQAQGCRRRHVSAHRERGWLWAGAGRGSAVRGRTDIHPCPHAPSPSRPTVIVVSERGWYSSGGRWGFLREGIVVVGKVWGST